MSAEEICRRFEIPRGSLYHLIKQGRIPVHATPPKPWYKTTRMSYRFDPAEVARALGLPEPVVDKT